MEKTTLNLMFENLLHIGNKINFWNTKMKPYIYGSVNGVYVINLVKTASKLEEVKKDLSEATKAGKKILFVATKIQSRDAFKKLAIDTGNFYVSDKWVPGLLTNFRTIKKRIATYIELLKDAENGVFDVLTKKEKAQKMLILEKLDKAFSGLKEMKKIPDIIFVTDGIYEKQALKEAMKLNIPAYAIFNTNGDIDLVKNLIPANTNSVKGFEFIASELQKDMVVGANVEKKSTIKKVVEKKILEKKHLKKPTVKKN